MIFLIGIEEKGVLLSVLDLIVTIDTYLNCQTLQQTFMVIKMDLAYNAIL
jgi:hypothetical protein